MMRALLAFLVVVLLPLAAQAEGGGGGVWFDRSMGCGRGAEFAKTGKIADLPGCTGRLPKNAPQVEVVLHDTKRGLAEAEEMLAKNKLDRVDPLLEAARASLAHVPPMAPEMPDRWEQSLPLYQRAIASLSARRRLAPHLEKLRAAHHAAVEAGRTKNDKQVEGGPAEALKAADTCVAAFSETRAAGVDLSVEVELEKDRLRPLADSLADCQKVRTNAELLVRGQEKAAKAKRAQWRKQLKGDRLKTFDAHPSALPELEGGAADSRKVARASVWKYTTSSGVEVYTFKANKLASRTVAAK